MRYTVFIKHSAEKESSDLPERLHDRIVARMRSLAEDARPVGARKLRGREGYRLRVGDYRVLYEVDDTARTVTIVAIAHRRDVYR